jgi:hypothetical protein
MVLRANSVNVFVIPRNEESYTPAKKSTMM